ncbi:putative dispersed gene family protein 1 (DGF-1), partial [Trypanosoma conorhini]
VFAHNVVEGPAAPATLQARASVTPPAALLAGCNTKDGAELTYLDAFAAARRVECGACKDGDAACRVPGPEMFGAAAVPRPEAPVDTSTGLRGGSDAHKRLTGHVEDAPLLRGRDLQRRGRGGEVLAHANAAAPPYQHHLLWVHVPGRGRAAVRWGR